MAERFTRPYVDAFFAVAGSADAVDAQLPALDAVARGHRVEPGPREGPREPGHREGAPQGAPRRRGAEGRRRHPRRPAPRRPPAEPPRPPPAGVPRRGARAAGPRTPHSRGAHHERAPARRGGLRGAAPHGRGPHGQRPCASSRPSTPRSSAASSWRWAAPASTRRSRAGSRRLALRCTHWPRRLDRRKKLMADITAQEITQLIKAQLAGVTQGVDVDEVGTVISVGDGIALVYGLDKAMAGELIAFPNDVFGLALNLEESHVGCVLMGETSLVKEGDTAKRTKRIVSVPVGDGFDRPRREPARRPAGREGPDRLEGVLPRRAPRAGRRRPHARQGADADRHQGHRRDDPDRPRPARAHHRRPPDRQDGHRPRRDHQPEGQGRHLRLRRDRPEELDGRAGRPDARGLRRDGPHDHRRGLGVRPRAAPVHRGLRRVRDGRVLHVQRPPRARHLRRPLQAGRVLPRDLAPPPPAAGPRGVPGRRLLPPQPAPRARQQAEQGEGRRVAHRAPDHRDAGGRRLGLHPDERHLDHGRPDLPRVGPLLLGPAPGRQRRHLRVARRRLGADQGHARDFRHAAPRPRAVPRARRVRAVRLRPRQDDTGPAQPRPAPRRDPQAEPVRPDGRRAPGLVGLRRHEGLSRRSPRRGGAAVRDGAPRVPEGPEERRSSTRSARRASSRRRSRTRSRPPSPRRRRSSSRRGPKRRSRRSRARAHGQPDRHPAPDPQREEHAADHEGDEDGRRVEAAPGAGPRPRGASLRRDARGDTRLGGCVPAGGVIGGPRGRRRPGERGRRARAPAPRGARGEERRRRRRERGQGSRRRLQHEREPRRGRFPARGSARRASRCA